MVTALVLDPVTVRVACSAWRRSSRTLRPTRYRETGPAHPRCTRAHAFGNMRAPVATSDHGAVVVRVGRTHARLLTVFKTSASDGRDRQCDVARRRGAGHEGLNRLDCAGYQADVIAVDDNPIRDITALSRRVRHTAYKNLATAVNAELRPICRHPPVAARQPGSTVFRSGTRSEGPSR